MMLWEVSKGMNIRFLVIPIFILFNLAETTSTFQSDVYSRGRGEKIKFKIYF